MGVADGADRGRPHLLALGPAVGRAPQPGRHPDLLRLGKVRPWDALFYVLAQFAGGTLGVLLVAAALGPFFREPPVAYVATLPGEAGVVVALLAEALISLVLMTVILLATNTPRLPASPASSRACSWRCTSPSRRRSPA